MIGSLIRAKRERDFLFARYVDPSPFGRDTGISSDALLRQAMTGEDTDEYPRDFADLARCERMYEAAPKHLRKRMTTTLASWRLSVFGRGRPDDPNWWKRP